MKKVIKLSERDLTRIIKKVVNEDISDRKGDLYSSINNLIEDFDDIDDSDIIAVLETILTHHKSMEGRRKRNVGHVTLKDVKRNFK